MKKNTFRQQVYEQLEPRARKHHGLSATNWIVVIAIALATVLAVVRTEPLVSSGREALWDFCDLLFGLLFLTEYVARIWCAAENSTYQGWNRIFYALTPGALIDLLVVIVSLAPMFMGTLFPLRILRIFGIVRFAKLGRLSTAMRHLANAVIERRHELLLTFLLALSLILIGATGMWIAEGEIQPDKFGSIPRAMWWAAITLTTIGYGDAYPVTVAGKVIAVMVAMAGIGLIAMPAGILASAFSDALARAREIQRS